MRFRGFSVSVALGLIVSSGGLRAAPPAEAPYLVVQTGSQESVNSVTVSPDGSLVATSSDGPIRLHDARTGALLRAMGAAVEPGARTVAFTPDGRGLACAGFHMDKLVRLWDAATGKLVRTFAGHTEIETYSLAISPDGKWLASGGTDKQILVWELATGVLKHRFEGQPFPVTALAFSPDSAVLASGGGEKTVRLWDTATGRLIRTLAGHRDWVSTVAFSPDGKTLASGSCDWAHHRGRDPSRFSGRDPGCESQWKLWDAATGELKRTVNQAGRLLSLAFAPDGSSLACGIGKDVWLYELRNETPGRVVTSHDGGVTSVAFTRDGRAIISSSHDRTARRVGLPSGTVEWQVPGYWEQVNSVALSRDGSLIATGSSDVRFAERLLKANTVRLGPGAVRLWDAHKGRLLRRLGDPSDQVMAVALSPDGRRVAAGGTDVRGLGVVRAWDAASGAPVWSQGDHAEEVLALAFAPDGSLLASAGADGLVKFRDPQTGAVVRTFAGHEGGATALAFSADGAFLASGAGDGVASLWDVRTGRRVRTFRQAGLLARLATGRERMITSVALSPDAMTLATCNTAAGSQFADQAVKLWDIRTGDLKRELKSPQTRHRLVAFSPDGTTLATNGVGKSIHLYDVHTGKMLHQLVAHPHPPQSAAFSTDGRFLVSVGDHRRTIVWDVAAGRLLATLTTFSESHPGTTNDDWLAYTSDGIYDGSPDVDRFLRWRVGDDLLTPSTLGPKLHRPEELQSALNPQTPKPDPAAR